MMTPRVVLPNVRLYLGDALEVLPFLDSVSAVVSDPPYGMDWDTDSRRFSGGAKPERRGRGIARKKVEGDDQPFDPAPWLGFEKVVLFGSNHYSNRLPIGTTLVWLKRHDEAFGTFLSDGEIAWMKGGYGVYCKRDCSMNGSGVNFPSLHPTQKPVPIMAWAMDRSKIKKGETVLDPYMGSGSTGIACVRTERKFIGIEKDPEHFETAAKRITDELNQGDLFRQNS